MMFSKSDVVKEDKKKKVININRKYGYAINGVVLLLGIYFRLNTNITFSVSLGYSGSIVSSLLKGFSISSGRSLVYLSIYGLLLTLLSKKESLKEFYTYYMVAVIFLALGSLIYFVV